MFRVRWVVAFVALFPWLLSTKASAADDDWQARVQKELAEREYQASENGAGLQAPNRAQDLRTYFDARGIRVHDRTAAGSPELLALTLSRVGRGKALARVPAGEISHEGARVEIRHPRVLEWYDNSDAGLEQGFTLAKRAKGSGSLVLELALEDATAAVQGEDLVFATRAGRRLRYGALHVSDARGRSLPAHFDASRDRVRIAVDDQGATYPVVIDPLLSATADAQLESNQASANLGTSVAAAGDVNGDGYADVIVGAPNYDAGQTNEGAAFVFLGSASGIASGNPSTPGVAQLESNQANSYFGVSVAGAGDVNGDGYADVIVGAQYYTAGESDEGAAFVFLGGPSGIASSNPATPGVARLESNQATAELGSSVAGAGDVNGDGYADVIVGAAYYSHGQDEEGVAFIFLGSASGIASGNPATAASLLESNQSQSSPEIAVAGAGDVNGDGYADVIVGWSGDLGAALIFLGSASGVASGNPSTAATRLDSTVGMGLGASVASAGDVNGDGYADVIVGAPYFSAGQSGEGAAFVFLGSASGIPSGNQTSAAAQLESNQVGANFGIGVAGAGDVNGDGYADVIVGAQYYDNGHIDEGAAFVFLGSASGIASGNPTTAWVQLVSNQENGYLGSSVAGAGDVNGDGYADVIVGAPLYANGQAFEGAAFVYLGAAKGIVSSNPATPGVAQLESNQASASFGWSVAGAGDVNRDGYADVIIGAPDYDAGQTDEGAAFVFLGSASGIASSNPATPGVAQLESNQAGAHLGYSVAGAGDVNGDGYADVIVGAYNYNSAPSAYGSVFVFLGGPSGIGSGNPATAATEIDGYQGFGYSVASAGDVNGDGYADVIVGAPGAGTGGGAFVYHGSPSGVPSGGYLIEAASQFWTDQAGAGLGTSVAGAGDVNGDGYADVIVGANGYDAGQTDEGAAFVFLGGPTGLGSGEVSTADARLESNQAGADFGVSVAGAGDVNGDGYADVIIGADHYDNGQTDEGAAFVFNGGPFGTGSGNPTIAAAQLESNWANGDLGYSVAGAGDVNGDGYADVIVGAWDYTFGQLAEGAAFVFLGSPTGIGFKNPATAAGQLESNQVGGHLGWSVASAGDVNGDGYADVIVGARDYNAGQAQESAAWVFLGNSKGRPVRAHQERGDGSGIAVQPWGGSSSFSDFTVELTAAHPNGAGRVRAEIQACPSDGVPDAFPPFGCTSALTSWVPVNGAAPAAVISKTLTGLTPSTLYHWRARVQYAAATGPLPAKPAHGPWRREQAQSVEADIRTIPEPGAIASLASGIALLAALARARRARR